MKVGTRGKVALKNENREDSEVNEQWFACESAVIFLMEIPV